MKKVLLLLSILAFGLVGCNPTANENPDDNNSGSYYILPDLNGYKVDEIEELFTERNQSYQIIYLEVEYEELELQFSIYDGHNIGDIVENNEIINIVVFPEFTGERTFIVLPDLTGFTQAEIESYFTDIDVSVSFSESYDYDEDLVNTFYSYGAGKEIGDIHLLNSVVSVILYKELENYDIYFFPIEMDYDGPLLSEDFADVDPIDPRGGYFEVTLNYCTDGDTGVFEYPTEIYDLITSSAKSTRFLNMDTEETYPGGEEEWGKPASVYTCDLLTSAESIILQTDPGDALTGTYGRLLAWIWIKLPGEEEYQLLNYMVVKQGLARVAYTFGAGETISYGDKTYTEWMYSAQDYAEAYGLGQWGELLDYYWDYATDSPDYFKWNSN